MPADIEETREYIVVNDTFPTASDRDSPYNSASLHNSPAAGGETLAHRRRSGRPDSLEQLRAAPKLREIPWYEGKEVAPERSIESTRSQTRGAYLLSTRGEVQDPPCTHCATGVGRFSKCIASDQWFNGACATCQLATRGSMCNLRKKESLRIKPEINSTQQETEALRSIPLKSTPLRAESRSESTSGTPTMPATSKAPVAGGASEPKSTKRKRETLQKTTVWKPYVSPYLPSAGPYYNPNDPSSYSSPAPNSTYPLGPTYSTDAYPVNYIYQKDSPQTLVKQTLPPLKAIQPAPEQAQPSRPTQPGSEQASPPRPTRSTPRTTPKLQPAVLRSIEPAGPPQPKPDQHNNRSNRNGFHSREATDSLSPSAQLLQPFHDTVEVQPQVQGFVAINVDKKSTVPPEASLIDTLPRKKQKQIYGIIGGLQSGIRSCKQQAESMQKQLDLLQAALGIDMDDDNDISVLK